jgi:hypothetical protein
VAVDTSHLPTVTVMKSVGKRGAARGVMELRPVAVQHACPGFEGQPCKKKSYLRSDSSGVLCNYCRGSLLSHHTLVDADKARKKLLELSADGIGLRTVALHSELSRTCLHNIKRGETKRIDPDTEYAILHFKVPKEGKESKEIEDAVNCICGLSHAIEDRLPRVRRMLPCTTKEIQEAYSCVYPDDGYEKLIEGKVVMQHIPRMLFRDLEMVGAVRLRGSGLWYVPQGSKKRPGVGTR